MLTFSIGIKTYELYYLFKAICEQEHGASITGIKYSEVLECHIITMEFKYEFTIWYTATAFEFLKRMAK